MRRIRLFVIALWGGWALAQTTPQPSAGPLIPAELAAYLSLDASQTPVISAAVQDYEAFARGKEGRIQQLQDELEVETARENLDPAALGARYAELEVIRRQFRARQADLRAKVRAALTAAQGTKLDTLAQAAQLTTVTGQAQCSFLIDPPASLAGAGTTPVSPGSQTQGCLVPAGKLPELLPTGVGRGRNDHQ